MVLTSSNEFIEIPLYSFGEIKYLGIYFIILEEIKDKGFLPQYLNPPL